MVINPPRQYGDLSRNAYTVTDGKYGDLKEEYDDVYDWFFDEDDDG